MSRSETHVHVRPTLRRLVRNWRHSTGVILVLAMGMGPATVGLSVRESVLLRPLPYRSPDRLGVLRVDVGKLLNHPGLAQTELVELREVDGPFQAVESVIFGAGSLDTGDIALSVSWAGGTPGLLETLGVTPSAGRFFLDDDPDHGVVVLGHSIWENRFGGDPAIVGKVITLGGLPREIVGILPREFSFSLGAGSNAPARIDLWTIVRPVRTNPQSGFLWGWNALVRLADGVSFQQANKQLEGFARRMADHYPRVYGGTVPRFTASPLLDDLTRPLRPAVRATLAGVGLLLLSGILNASALLILDSMKREKETAIRRAIGAPGHVLLFTRFQEVLILGVLGAALGCLLGYGGLKGAEALPLHGLPRWEALSFGRVSAAQMTGVTLLALLLTAMTPLRRAFGRASPQRPQGSPGLAGFRGGHGPMLLLGIQIAMTVVLLFGALQLGRSAVTLQTTELGFRVENVLAFEVQVADAGFSPEDKPWENQQYQLILDRLSSVPGITSVGAVSSPPLSGRGTVNTFETEGSESSGTLEVPAANFFSVLPGYFRSVEIEFLQGRDFTDQENQEGHPVAIIDETLARTAFPDLDPMGRAIRVHVPGGSQTPQLPDPRVVGVISHPRVIDAKQELRPQVYLPFGFWRWAPLSFTVRAQGDPNSLLTMARTAVAEVDPAFAVSKAHLLADNLDRQTGTLRSMTTVVLLLALFSSLLSITGLFAIASHAVARKRRSIAIRGAVGASPRILLKEQLRAAGLLLMVAVPAGVLSASMGARLLESLVYGVDMRDIWSLTASAGLGVFIGFLGAFIPARQAAEIDPASVLRAD